MNDSLESETTHKDITILYVDDEEMNLLLFKMNFEGEYPLYLASSGPEGLEILKEKSDSIVVVISDYRMPVMTGIEFIKKARALHDHIIYFMLTAYIHNDDIQKAVEEGVVYECLEKPLNVQVIESKIEQALRSYKK